MYLLDNFDHITSHIATQLASQQIKKEVQEYNNPTALGRTSAAIETDKSESQRIYEALGGK